MSLLVRGLTRLRRIGSRFCGNGLADAINISVTKLSQNILLSSLEGQ